MKEQVFGFRKKEGTVSVYREADMKKLIASLEDGRYEWVLRKQKVIRTLPQNALFHVYCTIIAKEIGMTMQWVKDEMKKRFLTVPAKNMWGELIINKETGEVLTEIRDTRDLSKGEMAELCENIRIYVMEFNIYLEKPNEQGELKFTNL